MKNTSRLLAVLLVVSAMLFAAPGCTKHSKSDQAIEKTKDKSGPEYTSAYVCPMHCAGSGSDEPGECSICGMKYRANKEHEMHKADSEEDVQEDSAAEDTATQGDHSGHDHN
jgi:hypothetical protein